MTFSLLTRHSSLLATRASRRNRGGAAAVAAAVSSSCRRSSCVLPAAAAVGTSSSTRRLESVTPATRGATGFSSSAVATAATLNPLLLEQRHQESDAGGIFRLSANWLRSSSSSSSGGGYNRFRTHESLNNFSTKMSAVIAAAAAMTIAGGYNRRNVADCCGIAGVVAKGNHDGRYV